MNLNPIKANMTEVEIGDKTILFSYRTPVACKEFIHSGGIGAYHFKYYRTNKKWSATSTRHINKWLNGDTAEEKDQEWFDQLV
jgi:hypothetical protein